jgi:hypothetical protein
MIALGTTHDRSPAPGPVALRHASSACETRHAPRRAVPAGYQQAQHLRGFCQHAAHGLDMARLCIGAWGTVGVCDIPAMTYAINAHFAGTTHTTRPVRVQERGKHRPAHHPRLRRYRNCAGGEWRNDVGRHSRPNIGDAGSAAAGLLQLRVCSGRRPFHIFYEC